MSFDVLIIGAGPVGLFAIHQCGMLGLKVAVADSLPEIGGQCSALYPEKPIYDIPAYPRIDAGDLIHQLEEQAKPFQPTYYLGQSVIGLNEENGLWQVATSNQEKITTKTIIIAAGAGAFGPNKPPLENLEAFEDTSVFYMVRRRNDFKDKKVVIAGGGDSAVDWAVSLFEVAETVTLVHRRAKFRAAPESVRQLESLSEKGKINLCTPYQLKSVQGENRQLSAVHVSDLDGHEKVLDADVLLPFFGLATDLGPIKEWGLNLERNHIKVSQSTSQTSRAGIYAIGDVAHYNQKLKLILTGFAEAAQAAHSIRKYLYPDQEFHFEYSTTKGVPNT